MSENKSTPASRSAGRGTPNILIHPVRLRIVAEFGGRTRTTQELAQGLPDIPTATLYRHVGILHDGGVLEVVDERPARGAVERTFRVAEGGDRLEPQDFADATRDDLLAHFQAFVASLVDTVAAALTDTDPVELLAAGLSANRAVVHLSDDERDHFSGRLDALVTEMLSIAPGPDRRPFTLGSIVIPGRPERTP